MLVLVYTCCFAYPCVHNRSLACCYFVTLLACSCKLYNVVSQDIVTVAVVLEVHVLVNQKNFTMHQHIMCFILSVASTSFVDVLVHTQDAHSLVCGLAIPGGGVKYEWYGIHCVCLLGTTIIMYCIIIHLQTKLVNVRNWN